MSSPELDKIYEGACLQVAGDLESGHDVALGHKPPVTRHVTMSPAIDSGGVTLESL